MSSIELPQLMDDNLITRRKKILQSIEDIRGKKAEIAQALRELGIGKPQDNENVKEDMKQLLAAYDAISAQETQYMDILKTIVTIHEQATLDIAKDFEKKIEQDAQKLKEKKEKQEEENEEEDTSEKTPDELANSEVMAELKEALDELKKVSEAAVAASELNEKLVERLQLTKKKKSAMMEVRAKKAKDLDDEATRVRAEVMERINKMAALKKTTGRQEKELKQLQKQCLELGLQLDDNREIDPSAQEALMDDNQRVPMIAETQQKPELNEEEKEKRREEIRENIKKEMEKEGIGGCFYTRARRINECFHRCAWRRKEQVNTLIREKLASMDARRKRLQQIRKMLEKQEEKKEKLEATIAQTGEGIPLTPETPRPSHEEGESAPVAVPEEDITEDEGPVTEKSLDDILANAKANLSNLTAMRERLEHIKETGGTDLNEEDVQLLATLETVKFEGEDDEPASKKPRTETNLIMGKDAEMLPESEDKNDIESAVRASFHKMFQPKPLSLEEDQRAILNEARRSAIEEMIKKIDEKVF
ncbi:hypothetical protein CAEBREN_23412 [Caenorhabditis brenneri]|uniref:Uncharacterized protein n=1 Tax=Caenorhabditis brenneri TaxID=135651 RepID=G0NRK4_CAEBE|nr:hypothetical protein CAEBREN_23412 [Caenorhabditis brenneri]